MKNVKFTEPSSLVKKSIGLIIFVVAFAIGGIQTTLEKRAAEGYDERMWTSASVASWSMLNGHVRNTTKLDNWFPAYAWRHKVDLFTGERILNFSQDTIRFPWDIVTLAEENRGVSFVVKYDTLKFPREQFQWFDQAMWTFGWKAPNLGKYIMGGWLSFYQTEPDGYFEFRDADGNTTGAPFAYPPENLVRAARWPNVLFFAAGILLVFLIGCEFHHFYTGLIAALLLLFNHEYMVVNTAVGLDSFVLFFTLLSTWLTRRWILSLFKNEAGLRPWILTLLLGIALGASVGSKLNGALSFFIAGAGFTWLLWGLFRKNKTFTSFLSPIVKGSVAVATGLLFFYIINPQIRNQPLSSLSAMQQSIDDYFEKRAKILMFEKIDKRVSAIMSSANKALVDQIIERNSVEGVAATLTMQIQRISDDEKAGLIQKNIDLRWKEIVRAQGQLEKLGVDSLPEDKVLYNWLAIKNEMLPATEFAIHRIGLRTEKEQNYYGTLGNWLPFAYNPLDLLFFLGGFILLLLSLKSATRSFETGLSPVLFTAALCIVMWGNTSFLWNDWARYFSPMLPWVSIVQAIAFLGIAFFLNTRFFKRSA